MHTAVNKTDQLFVVLSCSPELTQGCLPLFYLKVQLILNQFVANTLTLEFKGQCYEEWGQIAFLFRLTGNQQKHHNLCRNPLNYNWYWSSSSWFAFCAFHLPLQVIATCRYKYKRVLFVSTEAFVKLANAALPLGKLRVYIADGWAMRANVI